MSSRCQSALGFCLCVRSTPHRLISLILYILRNGTSFNMRSCPPHKYIYIYILLRKHNHIRRLYATSTIHPMAHCVMVSPPPREWKVQSVVPRWKDASSGEFIMEFIYWDKSNDDPRTVFFAHSSSTLLTKCAARNGTLARIKTCCRASVELSCGADLVHDDALPRNDDRQSPDFVVFGRCAIIERTFSCRQTW